MAESNHTEVIGFIASTVETLRNDVATMREQMATKEDLARLDGRLSERIEDLREQMATKEDLAHLDGRLSERIEDLREQMATKEDLARLDGRLNERLEVATTSIRGDIEQVQLRLSTIEHLVNGRFEHVEGEISRLRGAVYLLGKDRPEVLRLLGQANF